MKRLLIFLLFLPAFLSAQDTYRPERITFTAPSYVNGATFRGERGSVDTTTPVSYPSWYTPSQVNNIVILGNSFTRGYNATTPETGGYAARLEDTLKSLYGDGGSGAYLVYTSGSGLSQSLVHWWATGSFITMAGTGVPGILERHGYGWDYGYAEDTILGNKIQLIYYEADQVCSPFYVTIDGGDSVRVGKTTSSSLGRRLIYDTTFTLASDVAHKIRVRAGKDYLYFGGAIGLRGSSGVNVIRMGVDGIRTGAWYIDSLSLWQIKKVNPKYTIIELGINDWTGDIDTAAFRINITGLVDISKAYGSSVCLVNIPQFNSLSYTYTRAEYNAILDNIATVKGCRVLDLDSIFVSLSYAVDKGWQTSMADGHPTDAGHQKISDELLSLINNNTQDLCYDPSRDLPLRDCKTWAWYNLTDAANVVKNVNNKVTSITDLTGRGNSLAQADTAKSPTWSASGAYFDGSNDIMSKTNHLTPPITIYAVVNIPEYTASGYIWDGAQNNGVGLAQYYSSGKVIAFCGSALPANPGYSISYGTMLITAIYNGSNSLLKIGSADSVTGDVGAGVPIGFNLGGAGGASNFSKFTIKEMIIRESSDDAATRATYEAYLRSRNGL